MKDYLKKLLKNKQEQRQKLNTSLIDCESKEERSTISATIATLDEEIREGEAKLAELENEEKAAAENEAEKETEEARSAFNPGAALNVVASAKLNGSEARKEDEDPRATMEYRKAFMNYIQKGEVNNKVLQFAQRDGNNITPVPTIVDGSTNEVTLSSQLGILIPITIMQEVIKDVDKMYGQLYHRVRKTNLKGGVKYPVGSFSATFHRITEKGPVSSRQDAGGITGSIVFGYNIGEIRLARTLLEAVLTVEAFEREFAEVIATAYVKAMDYEIMNGNPENNECEGILTELAKENSRIPKANVIEFTDKDMADWKSWQTKLFSKIPLAMRGTHMEFVMTANTYEANIKTLADDNNRPVHYETFNPIDGTETASFKGKEVAFVENDIFKDFNEATDGEYFGMYWNPIEAYDINSNMEFVVMDYFDQETNQFVKKALVINDGKVLKGQYIYLLKKKVQG